MPAVDPFVAPILYAIPVQLLAYHVAVLKGMMKRVLERDAEDALAARRHRLGTLTMIDQRWGAIVVPHAPANWTRPTPKSTGSW